jgi:hypothetical protein
MRKLLLVIVMVLGCQLHAQIKVKVNDKLVTEGASFKAEDILKMELAFDKPKKLSYYGLGRLYYWVEILKESGNSYEDYRMTVDGSNAIEAFLMNVNEFKTFYADGKVPFTFMIRSSSKQLSLPELFLLAGRWVDQKSLKIRVSLFFRDKVGYEKYGDAVELVKPFTINLDNTYFYTEGQKQKEQEKNANDAKALEKAKADEAAKKAAEEEEKKGKGKKVLKKVLGW